MQGDRKRGINSLRDKWGEWDKEQAYITWPQTMGLDYLCHCHCLLFLLAGSPIIIVRCQCQCWCCLLSLWQCWCSSSCSPDPGPCHLCGSLLLPDGSAVSVTHCHLLAPAIHLMSSCLQGWLKVLSVGSVGHWLWYCCHLPCPWSPFIALCPCSLSLLSIIPHPHCPFPIGCCLAIHPVSRSLQWWHRVGCVHCYNMFRT